MDNLGDMAMLKVAIRRLRSLWPDAHIQTLTFNPDGVREVCPDIQSISVKNWGRSKWWIMRLPDEVRAAHRMRAIENRIRVLFPILIRAGLRLVHREWLLSEVKPYMRAVRQADLILAPGGGYFTEAFAIHTLGLLETLECGQMRGRPTAIFGCGFEPIDDPLLRLKAAEVLPRLAIAGCREAVYSPSTLASFGVRADSIRITGDDAIEIAYENGSTKIGSGIGIGLREAYYSEIDEATIELLRRVIHMAARRFRAPLVRVPISLGRPPDDASIDKIVQGYPHVEPAIAEKLSGPEALQTRIARCRIVISGSYHGAVFALAQGIPVIGLAKSPHYKAKMVGLAGQFGDSCAVVMLDSPDLETRLQAAIDAAWESAGDVRPGLLEKALQQMDAGRAAYRELKAMI